MVQINTLDIIRMMGSIFSLTNTVISKNGTGVFSLNDNANTLTILPIIKK